MNALINTSQCRVLVVDDMPETLDVLKRLLQVEGYHVQVAASRAEALALMEQERFHIAIVDIRLDAHDPDNRDGIILIHEIKAIDPTTAVIILTGHADLKTVTQLVKPITSRHSVFQVSRTLASDFITKTPEALRGLSQAVRTVFNDVVAVNWELHIQDTDLFIQQAPRRLRFADTPKPKDDQLAGETEELLRKLFGQWERIELLPLSQYNSGYSKTIVCQVKPWGNGDPGALTIVKLGEHTLIEREIIQYQDFIEGRVSNNRCPVAIRPAHRTRSIGGIVYTFIGLGGKIYDFAEFYRRTNDPKTISKVLQNLFGETLALQHGSTGSVRTQRDMRKYYGKKLRLKGDELVKKHESLLQEHGILFKSIHDKKFWLPDGTPLINPLSYLKIGSFDANYFETIIHGDLHAHNILIDRHLDTWIIDFADTGRGPLLQDYVAFETSLVVENVDCHDPKLLQAWAKALYMTEYVQAPALPKPLEDNPAIHKAHLAVLTLRKLALRERMGMLDEGERTYLIGLFFTMLRLSTVQFLPDVKRLHALLSAAYIAERLEKYRLG